MIVNAKPLVAFVTCIEKSIKKPEYIYLAVDNGLFRLFISQYDAKVSLEIPTNKTSDIIVGVNANEFINTIKRFNDDEITVDISSTKVTIKTGNVIGSYRAVSACGISSETEFAVGDKVDKEDIPWFVDCLVKCLDSVDTIFKDSAKFQDILISATTMTYVTRFTEAAVRICFLDHHLCRKTLSNRVVVPLNVAKMVKAFKGGISDCYIGSKKITFLLSYLIEDCASLLQVSFPYMDDHYPDDCRSYLKFSNVELSVEGEVYCFQRDYLMQALDLVTSTVADESQVKFEVLGDQEESLVWRISSKNVKGTYCEELVLSTKGLLSDTFFVHGKKMIKALSTYKETVILHNHSQSTIALIDDTGNDVTLLSKGVG